ncbi:MAG: hypothetical protein AAF598_16130 [Bacteroidota bacterium]
MNALFRITLTVLFIGFLFFGFIWFNKGKIEKKAKATLYPQELLNDTTTYEEWGEVDKERNRALWFLEVQYPFATPFTPHWDDYQINQYHAAKADFANYFKAADSAVLAIQIGPDVWDLWAFRQLVIQQVDDHYVVANSYFRHNRFTYKGIAVLTEQEFTKLHDEIKELKDSTLAILGTLEYQANFVTTAFDWKSYDVEKAGDTVVASLDDSVSGIIIDNFDDQTIPLYGLGGSFYEERDSNILALRQYQYRNWIEQLNTVDWKTTYPDQEGE